MVRSQTEVLQNKTDSAMLSTALRTNVKLYQPGLSRRILLEKYRRMKLSCPCLKNSDGLGSVQTWRGVGMSPSVAPKFCFYACHARTLYHRVKLRKKSESLRLFFECLLHARHTYGGGFRVCLLAKIKVVLRHGLNGCSCEGATMLYIGWVHYVASNKFNNIDSL